MEEKTKSYQSSSFFSDLFDVKDKEPPLSSSQSGIFSTIFPSPHKVGGKRPSASEDWQKQICGNQQRHTKQGNSGEAIYPNKNQIPIIEVGGGSMEPCHLSSSLYYGGQDGYSQSQPPAAAPSAGSPPIFKKSGGEDDSNQSASRGNWWQGSLYY